MGDHSTLLGRLLPEYIVELRAAHYTEATIDSKVRCIRSVCRVLMPEDLSPRTLEDLAQIRGWSAGTVYAYTQVIAAFTGWLAGRGVLDVDPFAGARRPRQPKYLPRPISRAELDVILAGAPEPVRTWAVLSAYAGLRRIEIQRARGVDLVPTLLGHDLHIPRGKGGRASVVPAHDEVVRSVQAIGRPGLLFTTRHGRPISVNHIGEKASDCFRGLGVDCTLHQLRHYFGTELYRNTHDILLVQRALRHESIRSTQIYVEADTSGMREAVASL